ncbi:UNVERIFIED_CONTAM: hypothetical protein HDU68_005189 [Siphonaria sp. JEL0065]|nr:hypothetical protein HDU68_005189 [Siphonaria sp. JEL0065]
MISKSELCTQKQLETLRVYRDKMDLVPTSCTIPSVWSKDLKTSPPNLCNGKKCVLADSKFGIQNCFRGWYPAPVICFRDLKSRGKRRGDITVLVYTNWYMFENSTMPRHAFEGLKLKELFEMEPYKSILPKFKSKKEGGAFWDRIKDIGLPLKTFLLRM